MAKWSAESFRNCLGVVLGYYHLQYEPKGD